MHTWYIPSEKIGQNIDPLRNSFFVANYQHWTSTSALEPFLGPLDPWGALGGPWVGWGGLTTPKLPFSFEDQFKPWNGLFWLITTSYTMFLRFWVKMGPSDPKKGSFWPKWGMQKSGLFSKTPSSILLKSHKKYPFGSITMSENDGQTLSLKNFQGGKIEIFGPSQSPTGIKGATDQMLP